jgi:hypothetical protein
MNKKFSDLIGEGQIKSTYKNMRNDSIALNQKWEKTGLLDGLKSDYERDGMAILLENQARQLISEVSQTGTATGAEEWSGVALPLVRRIFAEIAAKDFVSVQPMNLPSGLVFYLDFKYGTDQPGFNTTNTTYEQNNSVFGITNQTFDAEQGLYGAGRFGYSTNDYTASLSTTITSASWADCNYSAPLSASVAADEMKRVTVDMNTTNHDVEGVRSFYISGSGIEAYYPANTMPVTSAGAASTRYVTFMCSGSASTVLVKYSKAPLAYDRGDFQAQGDPAWGSGTTGPDKYAPGTSVGANALDIPEINVSLRSEPIVAKTKKLKAVWTPEFAQDLNAYHSIDAEAELTSMLSEYISMEIDLEILDMLILNAITTDYWSAKIGTVHTGQTTNGESNFTSQDLQSGYALKYTQQTWFQTLGTKLQKISNKIHQKTMRGGANFMVCSPDIATIIESIPGYAADTDGNQMQFAMGVQKVGLLNNRFTVYKNPYMKENIILMGFRGSQFLECGAVFCPYVPLIMTPLVYDSTNFTPRKGVLTRYAKKIVRPEFFGKLVVTHLNYV